MKDRLYAHDRIGVLALLSAVLPDDQSFGGTATLP
jgi:hypothetical protein